MTTRHQSVPIKPERLQEELAQHIEDAAHAAMLDGIKPDEALKHAEASIGDRNAITIDAQRLITWQTVKHLKLEFVFAVLIGSIAYSATYSFLSPSYYSSPANIILAILVCYAFQRSVLGNLRVHLPTYVIAAYLPLVAMLALGVMKDMFDAMLYPYPTNTSTFLLRITGLFFISSLTLGLQFLRRDHIHNLLTRLRPATRTIGFLPAAYFLGTAGLLILDPNRLNTISDSPIFLLRESIDIAFFSILGLLRYTAHFDLILAQISIVLLSVAMLTIATWKIARQYKQERYLPIFETNLVCYLASVLLLIAIVY